MIETNTFPFGWDGKPPTEAPVDPPTNVAQTLDVTSIANGGDSPSPSNPYPGGSGTYTLLPS